MQIVFRLPPPKSYVWKVMKQKIRTIAIKICFLGLLFGTGTTALVGQITQVWPGDANENGTVNHVDLLYLGIHFGDTGPVRDSISINWTAHDVQKWLLPMAGRPDPAHSDCNGDSTIDFLDLVAIETNYGFDNQSNIPDSTSFITTNGSSPVLSFAFDNGPWLAGTTDTIWIELGDSLNPVDSLLGFATTLSFDSLLVDSAYAFFDDSWLGTPGQDLIELERFQSGSLDMAATRTDQTNIQGGRGRIGGVVIVMTDNLKRAVNVDSLQIGFTQALALTAAIRVVPLVVNESSQAVLSASEDFEVLVYPVPTLDRLNIRQLSPSGSPIAGRLFDLQGRLARSFTFQNETALERDGLQSGLYLLELQSGDLVLRKRVIFLE